MDERRTSIEPVIKHVTVSLGQVEAFELFTKGMGEWWPLETHSIAQDTFGGEVKTEDLIFEEREGGRIYETMSNGSEGAWGRVLTWEPPDRVVFTWKPTLEDGPHTEVEVRFSPTEGGTQVDLEHRGWERLGADAEEKRAGYDTGWPGVLELFRSAAGGP